MRPLRIALAGGFGNGNFGNDASLEATLQLLRQHIPDALVSSICDDPNVITERFGIPAIKLAHRPRGALRLLDNALLRLPSGLANWMRALWAVRRFDVVLFAGTGVFDDYRTGPMGFPAQVFRWSILARLTGARLVFLAVGAGPIVNPISRFFLRTAAQCAVQRSYRDEHSRAYMESIGVRDRDTIVLPDVVFALPINEPPPPVRNTRPLTIGLGVMAYRGWRIDEKIGADYLEKLARFVRHAEAKGHAIRLLVAEPSDLRSLGKLKVLLADDLDRGGDAMRTLHDVMAEVRGCDLVIASRFHVLIAGLKLGRPCISLSYGPKHDDLMDAVGMSDFAQQADNFDFDLLASHVARVAAEPAAYSALVHSRVELFVAGISNLGRDLLAALR